MTTTIRIEGLDRLERKLGRALADSTIRLALESAANHMRGAMRNSYPPSTEANRPKEYRAGSWNTWYERRWGSKWALANGGIRGRKTSENVNKRWSFEVRRRRAIIGNNASYAPYLYDPQRQTSAMRRIGWKTTEDVANEEAQRVLRFFAQYIEKALS